MPMTNAERQARWRIRQRDKLASLEAKVQELETLVESLQQGKHNRMKSEASYMMEQALGRPLRPEETAEVWKGQEVTIRPEENLCLMVRLGNSSGTFQVSYSQLVGLGCIGLVAQSHDCFDGYDGIDSNIQAWNEFLREGYYETIARAGIPLPEKALCPENLEHYLLDCSVRAPAA